MQLLANIDQELEQAQLFKLNELNNQTDLPGLGVYLLYFVGDSTMYEKSVKEPIYVGKAIASGAAIGVTLVKVSLRSRLLEHKMSIEAAESLNVEDFKYKYLSVDNKAGAHFIPGIESYLIRKYIPLWNNLIKGFGNHDPGKGRYNQRPSKWDCLHPGRRWVSKLTGERYEVYDLINSINSYYRNRGV